MGVRNGIAIAQATELASIARSTSGASSANSILPAPNAFEHDPIADSIALQRVATALQNHISPLVAIESLGKRPWAGQIMLECDTLFCDLSGVTHLFDDEAGILRATHQCLAKFSLAGKLAIADNAAAAWAHAHYNPANDFISQHLVEDLYEVSVNGLRIETETKYTLDRLGVETIGALLRLPRGGLARRLGDGIVNRIAETIGEIEIPLDVHHAEQQHQRSLELEYPTDDLEIVVDRVGRLTDEIVASLSKKQRGALRLACRLDLVDRSNLNTIIGLFAPTLDSKHISCLINSSVETLKLSTPIAKITLSVLQSGPLRVQQDSLFSADSFSGDSLSGESFAIENDSVSTESLARLVDSLSIRLGRDAVLGVRQSDNPLPEKAYRTYSLTDHRTRSALRRLPAKARPTRKPRSNSRKSGVRNIDTGPSRQFYREARFQTPGREDARRRPLKLLRNPVRLSARSPDQGLADSGTATCIPAFQLNQQIHRIAFFWGPERIETGWWDGPTVRRDYYRVETDTGNIWWIYREIQSNDWYLHGRFS